MSTSKRGRKPVKTEDKRVPIIRVWGPAYLSSIFTSLDPFDKDVIMAKVENLLYTEIQNFKK